jgi:Na+/proline symporter
MLKKHQILSYLKYSIVAAILYLISVVVFLSKDAYTQSWILYIGNILFSVVIVFFVVRFANRRGRNANTRLSISAAAITTIMGMVLSLLSIFIILAIMKPSGYADVVNTASELSKPAPALEGNGHALMFILFMNAFFGNLGFGIFVSAMLPNMLKTDQSGETATINPETA